MRGLRLRLMVEAGQDGGESSSLCHLHTPKRVHHFMQVVIRDIRDLLPAGHAPEHEGQEPGEAEW